MDTDKPNVKGWVQSPCMARPRRDLAKTVTRYFAGVALSFARRASTCFPLSSTTFPLVGGDARISGATARENTSRLDSFSRLIQLARTRTSFVTRLCRTVVRRRLPRRRTQPPSRATFEAEVQDSGVGNPYIQDFADASYVWEGMQSKQAPELGLVQVGSGALASVGWSSVVPGACDTEHAGASITGCTKLNFFRPESMMGGSKAPRQIWVGCWWVVRRDGRVSLIVSLCSCGTPKSCPEHRVGSERRQPKPGTLDPADNRQLKTEDRYTHCNTPLRLAYESRFWKGGHFNLS